MDVVDDQIRAVISDFGSATPEDTGPDELGNGTGNGSGNGDRNAASQIRVVRGLELPGQGGMTIAYAAPEYLRNAHHPRLRARKPIDVYAFGITLLEMLLRRSAWSHLAHIAQSQLVLFVASGVRPEIPQGLVDTLA